MESSRKWNFHSQLASSQQSFSRKPLIFWHTHIKTSKEYFEKCLKSQKDGARNDHNKDILTEKYAIFYGCYQISNLTKQIVLFLNTG